MLEFSQRIRNFTFVAQSYQCFVQGNFHRTIDFFLMGVFHGAVLSCPRLTSYSSLPQLNLVMQKGLSGYCFHSWCLDGWVGCWAVGKLTVFVFVA